MLRNLFLILPLLLFTTAFMISASGSVSAERKPFYAECKTKKSMFVWYGLNINNERIERWSENATNWTFEYTGGDTVIIDGEHVGHIIGEAPDSMVFVWMPSTASSISFYSFAVNFRGKDIVAAEVNTASDFAGTQNKGGVWQFVCDFY